MFARKGSRRNLVAGGLGLATAAVATRAGAQGATPEASPLAEDGSEKTEFLFVQHFEGGTWMPKEGETGTYLLTLTGASASTTYFSDRPERIVGIVDNQQFLNGLGFTPADPPNAALVAHTEEGDQEMLIIELYAPSYDSGTDTLTYEAHILADYGEHGFAHLTQQQEGSHLPETLGDGSLFIDDCPNGTGNCYTDVGLNVGTVKIGCCWDSGWLMCKHCHSSHSNTYAQKCADAYPDDCSNGNCYVSDRKCPSY